MIADAPTMIIPLRMDEHGSIYVSGTRVTLFVILDRHQRGLNPENIHSEFPKVPLADIYAVIAYYLAHRDEVNTYIEEKVRKIFEYPGSPWYEEYLSRMEDGFEYDPYTHELIGLGSAAVPY